MALDQRATSAQAEQPPPTPGAAHDPIELSDGDADLDSEEDEDCDGDEDQDAPAEDIKPQLSPLHIKVDHAHSRSPQADQADGSSHHPPQLTTIEIDHVIDNCHRSQAALPHALIPNAATDPKLPGGHLYPQYWTGANMQEMQPGPDGQNQSSQPGTGKGQQTPVKHCNATPICPAPFEPPSQGWVEPRTLGPSTGHRRIAPKPRPATSGPIIRPLVPCILPVSTPPGEAEMMTEYALYPFATFRKTPQKYLTPSGLVTTEGYEYLPSAPGFPGLPGLIPNFLAGGGPAAQWQQQQQPLPQSPSQGAQLPQNSTAPYQPPKYPPAPTRRHHGAPSRPDEAQRRPRAPAGHSARGGGEAQG